jgi:hypothetical protein
MVKERVGDLTRTKADAIKPTDDRCVSKKIAAPEKTIEEDDKGLSEKLPTPTRQALAGVRIGRTSTICFYKRRSRAQRHNSQLLL